MVLKSLKNLLICFNLLIQKILTVFSFLNQELPFFFSDFFFLKK